MVWIRDPEKTFPGSRVRVLNTGLANMDRISNSLNSLAFWLVQCFGSVFIWYGSVLGWVAIRIQGFDDQELKKIYSWKKLIFLWPKWKTTGTIYISLGSIKCVQVTEEALKREHPALQNMKFLNFFYFCGSFLFSWIRIRIHWPDWIRIRVGIRNTVFYICRDGPGVVFTGGAGVDGKRYNSTKIRQLLGWSPTYDSFTAFIQNLW